MTNLLNDPWCTTDRDSGKHTQLTLPQLLATLLGRDSSSALSFARVRRDQNSYWYRFLVRCAVRALEGTGLTVEDVAKRDSEALAATIHRELAASTGGDGAWDLYRPELTDAGFLQVPAVAAGDAADLGFKPDAVSRLTAALGAKNHERKPGGVRALDPEEAVYALIEYQTGAIFGGRGNYESQLTGSRSGAASGTPFMGVWLNGSLEQTFRFDVAAFLSRLDSVRREHGLRGSVWALWTEPWNGQDPIPAHDLHPAFVPLARQVRLQPAVDGRFHSLWFRASKGPRVHDAAGGGDLGDPFTPVIDHKSGRKVRGTIKRGYDYREAIALMLNYEDKHRSPSVSALRQSKLPPDTRIEIRFEGTAFEQGKTVGFFTRTFPALSAGGRGFLKVLDEAEQVRTVHSTMLQDVATAMSALRTATRLLMYDDTAPKPGDTASDVPTEGLTAWLDEDGNYYEQLDRSAGLELDGEPWAEEWRGALLDAARTAFEAAIPRLSAPTGTFYERSSNARSYLVGRLKREFSLAKEAPDPPKKEEAMA